MNWLADESRSAARFAVERDERPDLRDLIDDDEWRDDDMCDTCAGTGVLIDRTPCLDCDPEGDLP